MEKERKTFREKWNYFVNGYMTCAGCSKGLHHGNEDLKERKYYCEKCYEKLPKKDSSGKPIPPLGRFEMQGVPPLFGYLLLFAFVVSFGGMFIVSLLGSVK